MIQYLLLISRQGKVRLAKWYITLPTKDKTKIMRDCANIALARNIKMCNVVEYRQSKVVCKRYASLYFIAAVDKDDNELMTLELIHHFVEVLDKYFGNVCELDLIFNFHKAYYILDEVVLTGELQEASKKSILKYIHTHESLAEESEAQTSLGAAGSMASSVATTVAAALAKM